MLTAIAKVVLVLLNIFMGFLAIILIAVGAVMEYGKTLFDQYVQPQLSSMLQSLTPGSSGTFTLQQDDLDAIFGVVHTIAIPLLIVGIVMFVITFCGCCGVCCNSKVLLLVYAILISIITATLIAGGIYVWVRKGELLDQGEDLLAGWVKKDYVSETSTDLCSLVINLLNLAGSCCGIRGYQDFDDYPKVVSIQIGGNSIPGTQALPASCCKDLTIANPIPADLQCTVTLSRFTSNMNRGCYQYYLLPMLAEYTNYVGYGGLAFLIIMAILTLFAWLVFAAACCEKKSKVSYA